ncbi:MAG: hypothetical protein F4Y52_05900 [Synechococcus sp. SB0664_bin_36]|nr:hypothetical protein [Synechococcus sp. SB0664_bin_36]
MPTLPPGLSEWLPSGFFTAFLGLVWYELKAGEARVNRRMDDLRDGVNKRIDELRDDMKEIRDDMKEIRQDVKTLLLQQAAKQPVTPER